MVSIVSLYIRFYQKELAIGKNGEQRFFAYGENVIFCRSVGYMELDDAAFQEIYGKKASKGIAANCVTVRVTE